MQGPEVGFWGQLPRNRLIESVYNPHGTRERSPESSLRAHAAKTQMVCFGVRISLAARTGNVARPISNWSGRKQKCKTPPTPRSAL